MKLKRGFRLPGVVRKTLISAMVLLLIAVTAGIVYVWYADSHNKNATSSTKPPQSPGPAVVKPVAPDPKTPVGVAVQSIDSPVAAGQNTSIQIQTKPQATCTIIVTDLNNAVTKDSGLGPQVADAYGEASWTWTVPKTAAIGKGSVKVTCVENKKSGVVIGELDITK